MLQFVCPFFFVFLLPLEFWFRFSCRISRVQSWRWTWAVRVWAKGRWTSGRRLQTFCSVCSELSWLAFVFASIWTTVACLFVRFPFVLVCGLVSEAFGVSVSVPKSLNNWGTTHTTGTTFAVTLSKPRTFFLVFVSSVCCCWCCSCFCCCCRCCCCGVVDSFVASALCLPVSALFLWLSISLALSAGLSLFRSLACDYLSRFFRSPQALALALALVHLSRFRVPDFALESLFFWQLQFNFIDPWRQRYLLNFLSLTP